MPLTLYWDILRKVSKLLIYKLLSGYIDEVKVYYSVGYYPESFKIEKDLSVYLEKEIGTYKDKGFKAFKMHLLNLI